jgi:peptidoglycan/LPS O-acetylase OafA/YrhL
VIAAATQPKFRPLGYLLSLLPLRAYGDSSPTSLPLALAIYFVLTGGRTGLDLYPLFAVRVCVTLALAIISYNLVETPFRHGVFRRWRASWTVAPAGAMSVAALGSLTTVAGL